MYLISKISNITLSFIILTGLLAFSNVSNSHGLGFNQDDFIQASDLFSFGGERDTLYSEIVSGIGDYNLDGYNDFVVGGRMYNSWQGKTWIYYGSADTPSLGFTIVGEPNRGEDGVCMGHSVFNAGDINGDGVDDFAASGPGSYGDWDIGKVYLFYGNPDSPPTKAEEADFELSSPLKYDWFGEVSRKAGDFNGDGYSDLIIGAPGTNWPEMQATLFESGRSYIYLGGPSGYVNEPSITMMDTLNYSAFGRVVDGDGDINNDGLSDVIISASWYDGFKGRAYVYLGNNDPSPNPLPDIVLNGTSDHADFGEWVGIINDLNGDGYDEFAVTTQVKTEDSIHRDSRVQLYFGREDLSSITEPDLVFRSDEESDDFGYNFNPIGDINQDGFTDFAIGAPGTVSHPGKVYVYHGGPNIDTTPEKTYIGEDPSDRFGYYVNSEDINGDSIPDLFMTALFNDDIGRVYIDLSGSDEVSSSSSTQSSSGESNSDEGGIPFLIFSSAFLIITVILLQRKIRFRVKI